MFFATLNRTAKAFALAIVGAEYVLRWLPRGTHDWRKFVRPRNWRAALRQPASPSTDDRRHLQPARPTAGRSRRDLDVNYMAVVKARLDHAAHRRAWQARRLPPDGYEL